MQTNYNRISYQTVSEDEKELLENETVLVAKEPKQIHATVSNCKKLNVRKESSIKSDILVVLNFNEELLVEEIKGDWAHVYTTSGISGYVMTRYIKV